ncbi:MAG: DUF447 domain-containing protein [Candidatus Helarchaeota archaeon]
MILFGKVKLIPKIIYEVLITTRNIDSMSGSSHPYNIAPMGIEFTNEKTFFIRPYKTTQTYNNLKNYDHFAVNINNNIMLFYNSLFEKDKFKQSEFRIHQETNTPFLPSSRLVLIARTKVEHEVSPDRAEFECNVIDVTSWNEMTEPFCRAKNLILESLIHYTRLKVYKNEELRDKLKEIIISNEKIVKRTARNTIYEEIMKKIIEEI